jgi:hypothetical protein
LTLKRFAVPFWRYCPFRAAAGLSARFALPVSLIQNTQPYCDPVGTEG